MLFLSLSVLSLNQFHSELRDAFPIILWIDPDFMATEALSINLKIHVSIEGSCVYSTQLMLHFILFPCGGTAAGSWDCEVLVIKGG